MNKREAVEAHRLTRRLPIPKNETIQQPRRKRVTRLVVTGQIGSIARFECLRCRQVTRWDAAPLEIGDKGDPCPICNQELPYA
jgi:hypothetical protein